MSDTDSFIEEVSEEVRRDRLFSLFRKYAWVAVLLVVLIVGGAAWNEYRKLTEQREAAALGDQLYAALQSNSEDRLDILNEIEPKKVDAEALVNLIKVNTLLEVDSEDEAVKLLQAITNNSEYSSFYRELASFKLTLLSESTLQEKYDNLSIYSQPGSTFRLIAMEEIALVQIQLGDFTEATKTLEALLQEPEINRAQTKRANDILRTIKEPLSVDKLE